MTTFELQNPSISDEHRTALDWFLNNAGQVKAWRDIEAYADAGPRLATLAKGIYKPAYTDYALSVRQTLNSPYADKELIYRPDGSWVYPYFQENADPAARDNEATNRGLMKCAQDGVPIGVMIQTKPKPGVEYLIVGLGRVLEWSAGYFIIEKFERGSVRSLQSDAAVDRVAAEIEPNTPPPETGVREWEIRQVLKRRGQARFRADLIEAYDGHCAISDCDAADALEACHVASYSESVNNRKSNGILLRADLHTLFDLGLLAIHPVDMSVILSPKLMNTSYQPLHGRRVKLPKEPEDRPNAGALKDHAVWAGLI